MKWTSRVRGVLVLLLGCVAVSALLPACYLACYWADAARFRQTMGLPLTLKAPPRIVRAGPMLDFAAVGVYDLRKQDGFWLILQPGGSLIAASTFCTHDGCTLNHDRREKRFTCPCCGSQYDETGVNIKGPADKPLPRFRLEAEEDSLLVNTSVVFDQSDWKDPGASVHLPSR